MKRLFLLLLAFFPFSINTHSQNNPSWLRSNSISPDGNTIAFAYQGDIFTVSASGGNAKQITSNPAYDGTPLWTSDGKTIVFSSYREQGKDIWKVSSDGGVPERLTTFPGAETPLAVDASGYVYFASDIQRSVQYSGFPYGTQLYKVSIDGGNPVQVSSVPMMSVSVNPDGVILYEDFKGYEDDLRKHHTSSVTRDIWRFNPTDNSYCKLSTFAGEDRNPVFIPGCDSCFFLSEASGNMNVWKSSSVNPGDARQITFFQKNPVRYISVANTGRICLSYNGDLYTMDEGSKPRKVEITLVKDNILRDKYRMTASFGAKDIAVSPNGKEIALVARGDVYVTSVEFKSTKRITDTPQQERGVSFSKDGRTLYYASERDGEWGIWRTELSDSKDKYFTYSYKTKEERFTEPGQTCFQPSVSPDGKWVAFLRDRTEIVIRSTKSNEEKSLLKGVNYSYSDGDQRFQWSPDSKYLLCTYMGDGGWNSCDVGLIDIRNGKIVNLTESGYSDAVFRWALGGSAMTFASDKYGYRSHGSWGAEDDIYIMFFDDKAYCEFKKEKEVEDIEKLLKGDEKKKESKDSTETDNNKDKKVKDLILELDGRHDRTIRLTRNSGRMGDYILSSDGKKLYYTVKLERSYDLLCADLEKGGVKVLKKGTNGRFYPDPDGKGFYILSGLSITRFDFKSGSSKSVSFSGDYEYYPAKEREYIFDHICKQVEEKFYDPEIHGLDWHAVKDNYKSFLPYINNNIDFREMLSEMLGELNGSHTGARYTMRTGVTAGYLGVFYDQDYQGEGLRIKEIMPGSVLALNFPGLKEGDVILAVDGKDIPKGTQWYDALYMTAGKRTLFTVKVGGKKSEAFLTPEYSDTRCLYKRWVRQREELTEKLSGGKIGYVHVEGMDSESFREVYSKALGKYRACDALIVDTRFNGGGWLHDDLANFLKGVKYIEFKPRGQFIGNDPFNKWCKPSCVVMSESNYSDACGFPYVYKTLGVGKLVGAPVPGTMTSVWWETQVDPTLVFGIPQVGAWSVDKQRYLENYQIEPDIYVVNDPESLSKGIDRQLEAAVEHLLQVIGK